MSRKAVQPISVRKRNFRKQKAQKGASMPLELGDAYEISKIFQHNNWIAFDGHKSIFQRYVDTLEKLNKDQKRLFIELTERFYWKVDYTQDIVIQLNCILDKYRNYKKYYVLRCVKECDQGKVKSPGSVAYEIKNPLIQSQLRRPVEVLHNFKAIREKVSNFTQSLFILVDDFIGTGSYAEKCLKDLQRLYPAVGTNRVIMCIAAMRKGINKLSNMHVSVFAGFIQERGISDFYTGYHLKRNLILMDEIEAIVKPKNCYHLGYQKSEALVCLKRCPNNTFPIYWNGKQSPYPRY